MLAFSSISLLVLATVGYVAGADSPLCTLKVDNLPSQQQEAHLVLDSFISHIGPHATCPDGVTVCSDEHTCCKLLSGNWGCCGAKEATCCTDRNSCCIKGTLCCPGRGCCHPTLKCCPTGSCCDKEGVCCDNGRCCPKGYYCCEDGKCCRTGTKCQGDHCCETPEN